MYIKTHTKVIYTLPILLYNMLW